MKRPFLLLALMMVSVPAAAAEIPVQTGHTEWDKFPAAKKKARALDASLLTDWAEKALKAPDCKVPGMKPEKFDIDVPYAVLVAPDGTVQRILIKETGCAGLNTLVGSTVHDWAQKGDFKPTGEAEPLWYVDRIAFARE